MGNEKLYVVEKDNVCHNIRKILDRAGSAQVYAVVKADGYNTGAGELAKLCGENGIRRFAITDAAEAETIVKLAIPWDEILVMRPVTEPETAVRLIKMGATLTIASSEDAGLLSKIGYMTGIRPKAQVKIDTGMGRRGFLYNAFQQVCSVYDEGENIEFTGIYTHFCDGHNRKMTKCQYGRFNTMLEYLKEHKIDTGLRHCCSSTGLFYREEMKMDAVRVGSALFGRIAGWKEKGLIKTGFCRAKIDCIRPLPAGATVGYTAGYTAGHDIITAVCSVGSRNGFGLSRRGGRQRIMANIADLLRYIHSAATGTNELYATIWNVKCPVLGAVGAETVVLDVSKVNCAVGDEAVFDINPMLMGGMEVEYI